MSSDHTALASVTLVSGIAACVSHKPGDPKYAWANGTWNGVDSRYDRTFQMEVVDGNKIIGTMTNCSVQSGGVAAGRSTGWYRILKSR
jgi:hypothetical protein